MKEFLGWPIVTAANCFDVVRELGIKAWEQTSEVPLQSFLWDAKEQDQKDYARFGPQITVANYTNPHGGKDLNNAFRTTIKSCAMTIAPVYIGNDALIPMTAEWKHGNGRITIVPPTGTADKMEGSASGFAQLEALAMREFEEETGLALESIEPLGPKTGLWQIVRSVHMAYYPFLGEVSMPLEKGAAKFDDTEHLQMLLFPPLELLELVQDYALWEANLDFGLETFTRDITYAALRKLKYM